MKNRRLHNILITTGVICALTVPPVCAAPDSTLDSLQSEQNNLENQKSSAQGELNSLQAELETLLSKISDLEGQLISKGQEISQAEKDLKAAEEKRQEQYDAMKLRIKYIYESGGDAAALERVITSGDITSMLTQAEYLQQVHEYDRKQLQAYAETVQEIEDLQNTLEKDMSKLENLESDYAEQQETLNTTISSKQDEISDLDGMLQDAARKVLEEQQRQQEAEQQAQSEQAGTGSSSAEVQNSSSETESDSENTQGGGSTQSGGSTQGGGSGSGNTSTETPSAPDTGGSDTGSSSTPPSYDSSSGSSVVGRAQSMIGRPYEWGAAGPDSFDCSGLVSYCLTGRFVHLWSTSDIITWPRVSNPQPGDICVSATHCGIYVGGGMMIHAPQTGDVVKQSAVHSGMIYVRYSG